jgi:hypothetical protein
MGPELGLQYYTIYEFLATFYLVLNEVTSPHSIQSDRTPFLVLILTWACKWSVRRILPPSLEKMNPRS